MGKERCKPRYQGSLGATFDLRLYLYKFNWKKKMIKKERRHIKSVNL